MENKITKLIVFSGFTFLFSAMADADTTLCKGSEYNYFSCQLTNDKIISFCSPSKSSRTLSYRYGRTDKIEMDYTQLLKKFGVKKRSEEKIKKLESLPIVEKGIRIAFINSEKYSLEMGKDVMSALIISQFDVEKYIVPLGDKPYPENGSYTKINDTTYLRSRILVDDRINGTKFFDGECKAGVNFQNLFELKNNTPNGLEDVFRYF